MRHVLIGAALGCLAVSAAYAQKPSPNPDPNAAQPSANQTEQATPEKAPKQTAPTGSTVPPAKSADTGKAPSFIPDASWAGRYVYSSDDKDLGKIVSVKRTGASSDIYFDMGGFLGLGAARRHVAAEQVQDVQNDRIVLRLTKAEAENLPAEQ